MGVAGGCAGRRLDDGLFRSPKGYRVAVPGPEWAVVEDSPADLELRHRDGRAGMAVHALCDEARARRPLGRLERQLLAGLRERAVLSREGISLGGLPARRAVLEAAAGPGGPRLRIETYTVSDGRCVWDLLYAAPADRFPAGRGAFQRFVDSFARE